MFAQLPPPLHEALVRAYISGAAHRPLRAEDLDMLTAPWLGDLGQAAFYRQIAQADQRYTDEIEPLYPTLDLPVQVVWGTEDTWIPVDRAHRLAALIPGARLDLVPDAGHLIQLDAPEHLTAVLARWLRTASPERRHRHGTLPRGGLGRAERRAWGWRRCSRSAAATSWSSSTSPS